MCVKCVQGFSFLHRYLDLRGPCQETFYNLGRGLHQLGLLHLAIHYYQKVLELPPLTLEVQYLCELHTASGQVNVNFSAVVKYVGSVLFRTIRGGIL